MPGPMTATQWVELFRAVGLTEAQMHAWHAAFERRYPNGHQSFLEWLNCPPEKIAEVRRASAGEWA